VPEAAVNEQPLDERRRRRGRHGVGSQTGDDDLLVSESQSVENGTNRHFAAGVTACLRLHSLPNRGVACGGRCGQRESGNADTKLATHWVAGCR